MSYVSGPTNRNKSPQFRSIFTASSVALHGCVWNTANSGLGECIERIFSAGSMPFDRRIAVNAYRKIYSFAGGQQPHVSTGSTGDSPREIYAELHLPVWLLKVDYSTFLVSPRAHTDEPGCVHGRKRVCRQMRHYELQVHRIHYPGIHGCGVLEAIDFPPRRNILPWRIGSIPGARKIVWRERKMRISRVLRSQMSFTLQEDRI